MDNETTTHSFMRRHWTDTLFAVAALFVSAISLWVGIRTESANEKLVAASSWPFVEIESSNGDGQGHSVLRFEISNSGVGPAKVKTFEVFWNGTPYRRSVDLMQACCGYKLLPVDLVATNGVVPVGLVSSSRVARTVIRAGDTSSYLTYGLTKDNSAVWNKFDMERQARRIRQRICYCSVLDECWIDEWDFSGDAGPRKVDTCPVPKVPYDQ